MGKEINPLKKLKRYIGEYDMYGNYVIRSVITNVTASFSIDETGIHWSVDDEATIRDLLDCWCITCNPICTGVNEQYANFEILVF